MTVKLAKFFSSSTVGGVVPAAMPPPLPPPNAAHSGYYHRAAITTNNQHYAQQQQQQQQPLPLPPPPAHYNPYMDDDEDNMSLYSTTASIMTARDHPFNNSQRPLLGERKPPPPQLLISKKSQSKLLVASAGVAPHSMTTVGSSVGTTGVGATATVTAAAAYISPYVQQQKRDSAKGLHGFNDFDILSQQYNQHLRSPHIGYPYGSPPSPTANSTDFVFDALVASTPPAVQQQHQQQQQPQPLARYGNVSSLQQNHQHHHQQPQQLYQQQEHNGDIINEADYYRGYAPSASRFEDDFCCRRNVAFAKQSSSGGGGGNCSATINGGPFIFGIPHEQQTATSMMATGGRGFCDAATPDATLIDGVDCAANGNKYMATLQSGQATMQQSTSDTSSSSRDSGNSSAGHSSIAAKFLLRKRKPKKSTSSAAVTKAKKPTKAELAKEQESKQLEAATAAAKQPGIKCVVVGDGAVGKTNLILSYLENRFNAEHVPTASDIYNADVMVNDSPVHLTLCDTAGQDTLDPLRELCYPDSDVFLLCFSVAKPETFHAIKTKWAPKFAQTKAALILVGTQSDLRTNPNVLNKLQSNGEKPISYADAWDLATTIGAKYIETSSVTQDKVKDVFDTAIWEGLVPTTLPSTPPPLWKKLLCLA